MFQVEAAAEIESSRPFFKVLLPLWVNLTLVGHQCFTVASGQVLVVAGVPEFGDTIARCLLCTAC